MKVTLEHMLCRMGNWIFFIANKIWFDFDISGSFHDLKPWNWMDLLLCTLNYVQTTRFQRVTGKNRNWSIFKQLVVSWKVGVVYLFSRKARKWKGLVTSAEKEISFRVIVCCYFILQFYFILYHEILWQPFSLK